MVMTGGWFVIVLIKILGTSTATHQPFEATKAASL